MRKTTLGKSGLEVSAVGFGGIPIMRTSRRDAVAAIHRAIDVGVTFFETAACYGDSQQKIGAATHDRRDSLVLATKSGATSKDGIAKDVEQARQEMRTDVIDLFQFHGISESAWPTVAGPDGALEGLLAAKEAGHIGHIGFTSHSSDAAFKLLDEDVLETVQFPFNLVACEPGERLIPKAKANNVGFIVMKPMCGGQFDDAVLAFKFLNGYPDLVGIPGIERPEEIEQIAAVVASGETLTGEDKVRADEIVGRLGKLFCRRCGYCQPCPNGVPIISAMIFEGLVKRMPPEVAAGSAKGLVEKIPDCVECGQCEEKCPYDLPIRQLLKESLEAAKQFLAEHG